MADKQRAVGLVGSILTCRAKAGRIRTLAAVHRGIPRGSAGGDRRLLPASWGADASAGRDAPAAADDKRSWPPAPVAPVVTGGGVY